MAGTRGLPEEGTIVRELVGSELSALLELYAHLHPVDDPLPAPELVE